MHAPRLVATGLVLAGLLAHPASAAAEERDRLTLRTSIGPTFVHGTSEVGGTAQLGLDVAFGRFFAFELSGAAGLTRGSAGRAYFRVGTGLRLGARAGRTRPYFGARVAHVHDAPRESYRDHPGQALSGDPSHGLGHVTLAGGALGVVFVPDHGPRRLRVTLELESLLVAHRYRALTGHGLHAEPRAYTTSFVGLGVLLR